MLFLRQAASSTFFSQFIFLLTGIITTIGFQLVLYSGAAEKTSLLPVAANYYGTALAFFLPEEKTPAVVISAQHPRVIVPKTNWYFHGKIIVIATLEILGNAFSILGILNAGSGVYQVLYSSLVVLTALWARIFLKKKVSREQWYAILMVTFGLSLSAFGSSSSSNGDSSSWQVTMGAIFTLISTTMYSFVYIMSESILNQKNAPTPQRLQTLDGLYVALIITIYLLTYTIPNFNSLVIEPVENTGGNWTLIIVTYIVLVLSGFGHSFTYFRLLGSVGSVSTGILNSLRAVSVFGMSAWLFCDAHPNQCFTFNKGISTMVVILGITYFTKVTTNQSNTAKKLDAFQEL